jgi:hypothetical protein
MEMDINFYTVIVSIVASLFGGWFSSFLQMRRWKQSEKFSFMWNFRLKIVEAEKLMWDTSSYRELNSPLNWLIVASQDPRVNIDESFAESYSKAIIAGWRYLMESVERGEDDPGISTSLLEKIEKEQKNLDRIVLNKMKDLKV